MSDTGEAGDAVDPRVHVELDRLNSATADINRLEVALGEARLQFRRLLCESAARVDALRARLRASAERARPYYEARFAAGEALRRARAAAARFERAHGAHCAAREMVFLAEQGLGGRALDPAWQEMLNHATQRVNEAEGERAAAGGEHRAACARHAAAGAQVQALQGELKRAIAKSSLSIRRNLMLLSSLLSRHELLFLPYYEMKAHFNHLLDHQKTKVEHYESQVATAKLTYAEALRHLEHISDEIHRARRAAPLAPPPPARQPSLDSTESLLDDLADDEYKSLPSAAGEAEGHRNAQDGATSPNGSFSVVQSLVQSHSSEWTEINLDSSPDDVEAPSSGAKALLSRQNTVPSTKLEELSAVKGRLKLDTNISSWISRSSAKTETNTFNSSRRQSLDNLLGPTGDKVKEIFSQGIMMLNISSLTERRNSEPKVGLTDDKLKPSAKKIPSPLEKTLTYLAAEEDTSDTESVSSVDMLNDEQINSLMLDKEIGAVCERVLGTPISEVVPSCPAFSQSYNK